MKLKVAVLQKQAIKYNNEANLKTILDTMKVASSHHADIVLLPECFLTGYILPISNQEAIVADSTYLHDVCLMAKTLCIGVVFTAMTKGKTKPKNTAFIIDKNGIVLMNYAKVHTCDFADEKCLESGDTFQVCDFHGVKVGVMICYDREYPESARVLMLKGAEIILVPNDCASMKPRVQALSTRAYENMVGIAMANPNGINAGNSCAFSPICWDKDGNCIDNILFLANDVSEGIYYADFDMAQIRSYREREMMGNTFRKVNAYKDLLSIDVEYPFIRKGQ